MAQEPTTTRAHYTKSTITLPITEEQYRKIIDDPSTMRREWIDPFYRDCPELFPPDFQYGYEMKDRYHSKRLDLNIRRVLLKNGEKYAIRPAFALPMMVARVEDVEAALFLRKFSVPYWALVRLFGRNVSFWYRLEISFGRNNIVGTTVKTLPVPVHLLADEHHEWINGEKIALATTVAEGCVLGAEVSPGFSKDELKEAYGVFKDEAIAVDPKYAPETVNTDDWNGHLPCRLPELPLRYDNSLPLTACEKCWQILYRLNLKRATDPPQRTRAGRWRQRAEQRGADHSRAKPVAWTAGPLLF